MGEAIILGPFFIVQVLTFWMPKIIGVPITIILGTLLMPPWLVILAGICLFNYITHPEIR